MEFSNSYLDIFLNYERGIILKLINKPVLCIVQSPYAKMSTRNNFREFLFFYEEHKEKKF